MVKGKKKGNDLIKWYSKLPPHLLPKIANPAFETHKIQLPCRIVLVGASGSGKTQLILQTIYMMPKTFTQIILCVQNADEPLYNFLKTKIPEDQLTVCEGIQSIPDLESLSRENGDHTLVILDDLCNEKDQRKICEYYLRARKIPASLIYSTQSFYAVPKMVRINSTHVWLKKLSTVRDLKLILSDFDLGIGQEELLRMYNDCVEAGLFLNIAVCDDIEERYRKGYTEVIPVDTGLLNGKSDACDSSSDDEC
jgi:hypothetical protein